MCIFLKEGVFMGVVYGAIVGAIAGGLIVYHVLRG